MPDKLNWEEIDRRIEGGLTLDYDDVIALYHLAGGKKRLPAASLRVTAPAPKPAAPAVKGPVIPESGA